MLTIGLGILFPLALSALSSCFSMFELVGFGHLATTDAVTCSGSPGQTFSVINRQRRGMRCMPAFHQLLRIRMAHSDSLWGRLSDIQLILPDLRDLP